LRRLPLRITLDCNNACGFCAQKGLIGTGVVPFAAALEALRAQADEVTFVGGEPTLVPELAAHIALARELGFKAVGIQTNGRKLADGDYVRTLTKAGLTDIHMSIHGSEPAVHDYHVGVPGAFIELIGGIGQARARGLTIAATTVLTRSNHRVLQSLPRLLKASGVSGWLISIPRVAGALSPKLDRLTPRLGLALPFALAAMSQAAQVGLESWIQGAPACTLGPFATRILLDTPRAYAAVCEGCPSRTYCPGVDPKYLERFHGDELTAKQTPVPGAPPAITRLFVGVGELAPSITPEPAAPIPEVVPEPEVQVTQLGRR
jgi:hypothetical protein